MKDAKQSVDEWFQTTRWTLSMTYARFFTFVILLALLLFGRVFTFRSNAWQWGQTTDKKTIDDATMNVTMTASTSALHESQEQQQRLNASQILTLLEAGRFNKSLAPLVFPKPSRDNNAISIYSKSAWSKLHKMLLLLSQTTVSDTEDIDHKNQTPHHEISLCVNGGSSSASAGFVHRLEYNERYPQLWSHHLSNSCLAVHMVDRAHGARNSLHSAFMMHSFLPLHPDVLLWEFSINDVLYDQTKNATIMTMEARNQVLLWLDQVVRVSRQRQSPPPLVIFIYLWNKNQYGVESGVNNPYRDIPRDLVYEAHQQPFWPAYTIQRHYDFVVGHVHLGKYLETVWDGDSRIIRRHFFADSLHPNPLAHQLIFYLLQDLVLDEQRMERSVEQRPTITHSSSTYEWACDDNTPQKRLLKGLLQDSYPIASYTQEEPKNENMLPGMLQPREMMDAMQIQNLGKSNALRKDRKYAVTLPCCKTSVVTFENVGQNGLLRGVQLSLFPDSSGLLLYLDADNVTDQIFDCINTTEWECVFSDPFEIFYYWVVLDTKRNVSNITMCNNLPTCGKAAKRQKRFVIPEPSLQAMTVFGDDGSFQSATGVGSTPRYSSFHNSKLSWLQRFRESLKATANANG